MTKAVLVAWHKYNQGGDEYYDPIYRYFLKCMNNWVSDVDQVYFLDSTWGITKPPPKTKVIKVNQHLRYYDAYKSVLPEIKEDAVLFLDNDMVIYRRDVIGKYFSKLEKNDVVSIYDTIGTKRFNELGGKSKFCPYFFMTKRDILMDYRKYEWGPVPWGETLSELTLEMLNDGLKPYEVEEDKTTLYIDGSTPYAPDKKGKNLGYYHIRAGSVPAVLHSYRNNYPEQYTQYIQQQPRLEYLRQLMWYDIMGGDSSVILDDIEVSQEKWQEYKKLFIHFHHLP